LRRVLVLNGHVNNNNYCIEKHNISNMAHNGLLKDNVAIITGSGRGIG